MGSLLERDLVKLDFDNRYPRIVDMMHDELDIAKVLFDKQMARKKEGKMMLNKNMPLVSGSLRWSAEILARISGPMADFKHIQHP